MTEALYMAVISAIVSIVTIFGVKVYDGMVKKRELEAARDGKEFDDGVERRKELIKEIERLNTVITAKDENIKRMQEALDRARDAISDWAIKYTKLEGHYIKALEDLQEITGDVTKEVSKVKHDMIDKRQTDILSQELADQNRSDLDKRS